MSPTYYNLNHRADLHGISGESRIRTCKPVPDISSGIGTSVFGLLAASEQLHWLSVIVIVYQFRHLSVLPVFPGCHPLALYVYKTDPLVADYSFSYLTTNFQNGILLSSFLPCSRIVRKNSSGRQVVN